MEAGSSLSLKRRYEEVDNSSPFSTPKDSDDDISSSDSADSCDSLNPPSSTTFTRKHGRARPQPGRRLTPCSINRPKSVSPPSSPATSILRQHRPSPGGKRVRFDLVTVYYFPRRQGFTSVPSQGGSSLGMARHHSSIRHYTLGEFAREQESSHRHTLRQHLRQEKLKARKMKPLPTKRRRALLRASGIARIDAREKAELRSIRLSREECGCDCRLYCDPRHCGCSQAGIKCQVDRMSFPCGCSRDGCGNVSGRIEFNPLRVRTHYLHTIMKLDVEKKRMLIQGPGEPYAEPDPVSSPSSVCPTSPTLSSMAGLDSELEEGEAQPAGEARDLLAEQDILERENETAVLHLQSAEEQERREREEAVQQELGGAGLAEQPLCLLPGALGGEVPGVDQVLLQGPFPTGATVLCISENQEESPSDLLKDSASLLYYQLNPIEPGAFETPPKAGQGEKEGERPEAGEKKQGEEEEEELKDDGRQSVGEAVPRVMLCSEKRPAGPTKDVPKKYQGEPRSEREVNPLPPEV
ncbi:unnamed protein product [Menidia menidia]|uniref:(Atlantic silverside) hypothetical protein n=1 Tax=Menidia menidia TaxID=238744 RepID=A0A8S4C075_9TELE|nr:unnamed protein product [Menidia menidia]